MCNKQKTSCIYDIITEPDTDRKFEPVLFHGEVGVHIFERTSLQVINQNGILVRLPMIAKSDDQYGYNYAYGSINILNPHGCDIHGKRNQSRELYHRIGRVNECLGYAIRNDDRVMRFYLINLVDNESDQLGIEQVAEVNDVHFIHCMITYLANKAPYELGIYNDLLVKFIEREIGYKELAKNLYLTLTFRYRDKLGALDRFQFMPFTDTLLEIAYNICDNVDSVQITLNITPR